MSSNATEEQWLAQYAHVREQVAKGPGPGFASPDRIKNLTGLEQMQGVLEGRFPYAHIAATLDFSMVEIAYGKAVFQGTPQIKHYNPMGTVHGGWYATLLDSAVGCAVHTTMPVGRAYTTAELSVNIVKAASAKSGPLRAIGTVIHVGKQLATAEGKIVDAQGKLYAHATTTCLVFEMRT